MINSEKSELRVPSLQLHNISDSVRPSIINNGVPPVWVLLFIGVETGGYAPPRIPHCFAIFNALSNLLLSPSDETSINNSKNRRYWNCYLITWPSPVKNPCYINDLVQVQRRPRQKFIFPTFQLDRSTPSWSPRGRSWKTYAHRSKLPSCFQLTESGTGVSFVDRPEQSWTELEAAAAKARVLGNSAEATHPWQAGWV